MKSNAMRSPDLLVLGKDASDPVVGEGLGELARAKIAAYLKAHGEGSTSPSALYSHVLHEVERVLLEEVLFFTKNNQSAAAHVLGIHRNTLRQRIKLLRVSCHKNP
ncbi:hypothetical protein EIL50_01155 [bacterium NHP-B]|nr:hypothetical protein EIL50_01155 [bacterium NHP-B]